MTTLEVLKMGNPGLRTVCKKVVETDICSDEFQTFLKDMVNTMREKNGVGIAAPQVGVSKRVFAMEVANNPRYPGRDSFPLVIIINPEIRILSNDTLDSWEGCLSIPGIRGQLKRAEHIELSGVDSHGNLYREQLTGFPAIVAQHEMDHLNGILFIDRMTDLKTLSFEAEFDQFWNK